MRTLLIFSLIALASAQYHYEPNTGAPAGHATQQQPLAYNKEFYSFAAPSQDFEEDLGNDLLQSAKRNVRVIFIRGPESNSLENAALQLAKASSNDRTAIYVLNKQADVSALAHQLQSIQSQAVHKPEVHFVRYRTESDAQNAQRAIQSQYDNLPGSSTNHGAGNAPVINFASPSLPAQNAAPAHAPVAQPAPAAFAPPLAEGYLPPNRYY